jgi:hypothetical protein
MGVFLSGSHAKIVAKPTGPLQTKSCGNFPLVIEITDDNDNPMPSGTTVAAVNTDKVTIGQIFPATVLSIDVPADLFFVSPTTIMPTYRVFSTHLIPVKPDTATCQEDGTNLGTGSFGIAITTPIGSAVLYSFSLSYPAK